MTSGSGEAGTLRQRVRNLLRVPGYFLGDRPTLTVHVHFWRYVTVVPDVGEGQDTWTRRVCRWCGGREDLR